MQDQQDCAEVWNSFVKHVEDLKPAVVVVIGSGSDLLQDTAAQLEAQGRQFDTREETFTYGLRNLIATLQRTSRVIYVRELPSFESEPACFLRRVRLPSSECSPTVSRPAVEERMTSYNRIVDEIQEQMPELRVVDSIPFLCGARLCSQQLPSGEIIYSDTMHLSPAGGERFARMTDLPMIIIDESIAAR